MMAAFSMSRARRQVLGCFVATFVLFLLYIYSAHRSENNANDLSTPSPPIAAPEAPLAPADDPQDPIPDPAFLWRNLPVRFPVPAIQSLPEGKAEKLPKLQSGSERVSRMTLWRQTGRQAAVKEAFERCWNSYKTLAWMADELAPVSGLPRNALGGWAATLVDNLDTLWIIGMREEFNRAVEAVTEINFEDTPSPEINTHEINIRHLGGLLAAYDLSADRRLLRKAVEVGDMLYAAFDTFNRLPITHWDLHRALRQEEQPPEEVVSASELGSFILEFTRLTQITRDQKYFDAAHRVMARFDYQQDRSKLAGMWPARLSGRDDAVDGDLFTMGAEVDSLYKTLPKAYALMGGRLPMYRKMYEKATRTAVSHSFFRPMNAENKDILVPGSVRVIMTQNGKPRTYLETEVPHRACFAGGMFALGGALFNIPIHKQIANKLVDGCIWASQAMPLGIMPAMYETIPCASQTSCPWNEWHWKQEIWKKVNNQPDPNPSLDVDEFIGDHHLPRGFIAIPDAKYNLRPETIESMFMLYRITGREDLLDTAWELFESIQNATQVENGNAALADVMADGDEPLHNDSMESFWMAQTLKYFYLMFGPPDQLSLDKYVFNSGGHPLKLPQFVEEQEGWEFS